MGVECTDNKPAWLWGGVVGVEVRVVMMAMMAMATRAVNKGSAYVAQMRRYRAFARAAETPVDGNIYVVQ